MFFGQNAAKGRRLYLFSPDVKEKPVSSSGTDLDESAIVRSRAGNLRIRKAVSGAYGVNRRPLLCLSICVRLGLLHCARRFLLGYCVRRLPRRDYVPRCQLQDVRTSRQSPGCLPLT